MVLDGDTVDLFVYGTLKDGYELNYILKDAQLLEKGSITPTAEWEMFSLGAFPGIVHVGEGGRKVRGDLYRIPVKLVDILDLVEGEGRMYKRRNLPPSSDTIVYECLWHSGIMSQQIIEYEGVQEWVGEQFPLDL